MFIVQHLLHLSCFAGITYNKSTTECFTAENEEKKTSLNFPFFIYCALLVKCNTHSQHVSQASASRSIASGQPTTASSQALRSSQPVTSYQPATASSQALRKQKQVHIKMLPCSHIFVVMFELV